MYIPRLPIGLARLGAVKETGRASGFFSAQFILRIDATYTEYTCIASLVAITIFPPRP
jgi:hypothetical protein